MTSSTKSSWRQVISGIPWGFLLGQILFNIFVNNLDDVMECLLSKFADDVKLGQMTPGRCAAIQQELGRLEKRAERDLKLQ